MSKKTHTPKKLSHKKRQKTWTDHLLTFIILTGLSVSVALVLNEYDSTQSAKEAAEALTLANVQADTVLANQQAEVDFDYSNIKPVTAQNIADALSQVNVYDLPVIGGVAIPDLQINLPIIKGISDAGMFTGAATMNADQQMGTGNYPLASHRSLYDDVLFGALHKATTDMPVYLSDLETVYQYTVVSNEVVSPETMSVLDPTETPTVTFITCTLDSKERVIVRAELVEAWPIDEAPAEALDALNVSPENGYQNAHQ